VHVSLQELCGLLIHLGLGAGSFLGGERASLLGQLLRSA
jgi:hypothetical protein